MSEENIVTDDNVTEISPEDFAKLQSQAKPGRIHDEDLFRKLFLGVPLTHEEIADIFGVSRVAVTNKVKKLQLKRSEEIDPETYMKHHFAREMRKKIQVIMDQITPDKLSKTSLQQAMTVLGILYDKLALHERQGQPEVSYVGVVHKFDPGNIAELKKIMQAETQRRIDESRRKTVRQLQQKSGKEGE